MKRILFAILFSNLAAFAAEPPPQKYVEIQKPALVWLPEGRVSSANIKIKILNGLHLQANPAALPNLKPTTISFPKAEGIEMLEVEYPPGKPYRMLNTAQDLSVYEGTLELKVPLKAVAAKLGKVDYKGEIKYQACNDKICFFPRTESIVIPIHVFKNK